MNDKLKILPGGGNPEILKEMIRRMKTEVPLLIEYNEIIAKLQWTKFDALKKEGFTNIEALELCKKL